MFRYAAALFVVLLLTCLIVDAADPKQTELWAAAKKGDAPAVESILNAGVDVDSATDYGATALHFAADRGHLDVVRTLIAHQANVNIKDRFYGTSPIFGAAQKHHAEIVGVLLDAGSEGANDLLTSGVATADVDLVRVVLEKAKLKQRILNLAMVAVAEDQKEIIELLEKAGAKRPKVANDENSQTNLKDFEGTFHNDDVPECIVKVINNKLSVSFGGQALGNLVPTGENAFEAESQSSLKFEFQREDERVSGFVLSVGAMQFKFQRSNPRGSAAKQEPIDEQDAGTVIPQDWSSFRGPNASGIADGQKPPIRWDVEKGVNLRWKTDIPGLGHACPIICGDRVYLTTAIRIEGKSELRVGLYGDVDSVDDTSEHAWWTYCLDRDTGRVLWERIAHQGIPKSKRHTKATHANCTPASDGKHVVVNFGSEGLYCYDREGRLAWHRDSKVLGSGWFYDPDYEWGFGSSPTIYKDLVIVQCDVDRDSFIAAYRLTNGDEVWRTGREEIPSWGSPTIIAGPERTELVTNATKFARGYDPLTGKELWRLARHSEVTVPTPFYGSDLIFVASGYAPIRPIYAIRPGAVGDISLDGAETANEFIAWSASQGGSYMTTPIVYDGRLYVLSDAGILTCYDARTGAQTYKKRLPGSGAYTASPVAADGRLYFTSEADGVRIVKAGPEFELLAENPLGEVCLATPAISNGMLFFRTESHVLAVGRNQ